MVKKNIVIVTDCKDIALEQVKARLISILPDDDLTFFYLITPPFKINNGLFLSKLISEEIPHGKNTLFLAIINPLKMKPKRIFGRLKNGTWFVGADTGIFSLLFKDFGIAEVYEGKNQDHYPFGGLHVHTVTAGKLLSGVSEEEIGNKIDDKKINQIIPRKGEVIHIDNFGLIKIWTKVSDFDLMDGDRIKVKISNSDKTLEGIFSNRMMSYGDESLIVYPGSSLLDKRLLDDVDKYRKSGLIEIGLVRNPNSAGELGINLGDVIEIIKIDKK